MAVYTTRRVDLFTGSSAQNSTFTSDWHLVADWNVISASWYTDETASSRLTLQGSNDDGLGSAIANISTVTAITVAGLYSVTPGMRWLRAQRGSEESLAITQLQLQE